ncbi:class I SAM-dependent methyltransferase [Ferriphaselus sp. R-1]|uniref:class I SAM-dependent methyltransferase n=1 Tax=Ferriphaselus sp. R-1 TaxID=1485544 RepID=UPI000550D950|nr:class I SAM-dependent methyltransferase [Ferriphaselus sp. R-1]
MSLQTSYRFIAPFYDVFLERATREARRRSLQRLPIEPAKVFLGGAGTGLDFPLLPPQHDYVALDITAAMLTKARPRSVGLNLALVQGDSMALPFAAASFDCVVLHLIVAVVPHPAQALAEAARVLKPGGTLLVFDKFLRAGQVAPLRRALSPLIGQIATRTDVVFEEVLAAVPELNLRSDEAALAGGWFRLIELEKP